MGNEQLLRYFEERPVHIGDFMIEWEEFINNYLNETNRAALVGHLAVDHHSKITAQDYNRMPEDGKRFFADYLEETGVVRDRRLRNPINAPAWMLLEPTSDSLLPSTTRVVHFTNNADEIVKSGFLHGVADPDRIAITHFNNIYGDKGRSTENGLSTGAGFNCGFRYNSYAEKPHHAGYGTEAVLFETSGLECHHIGDRERQVYFWGPSIDRSTIKRVK